MITQNQENSRAPASGLRSSRSTYKPVSNMPGFSDGPEGAAAVRRRGGYLAAFLALVLTAQMHGADRLDRENLLTFRDAAGQIATVKTTADWQKRRAEILAGMQQVMGRLPGREKRVALDVKVLSETDCGTFVRREILYTAEPGSRVPAFLLIPKAALEGQLRPGILALMPTNNLEGNRPVVGLNKS